MEKRKPLRQKPVCNDCKIHVKQAKWSTQKRLKVLTPVLDTTKL